jgi:uncharacterized membrane protein (UPF0127 family)
MRLVRTQPPTTLVPRLEVADGFWARAVGLLGRRMMELDQGMLFHGTNSIHTFFMRFALDLVFLDKQMVVVKTVKNVRPGRLVWPVWSASTVIELREGFLDQNPIRVGEKLHVDSALS